MASQWEIVQEPSFLEPSLRMVAFLFSFVCLLATYSIYTRWSTLTALEERRGVLPKEDEHNEDD